MSYITPPHPENQPEVKLPGTRIPAWVVVFAILIAVIFAGFVLLVGVGFVWFTMTQGYAGAFATMAYAALPW